MTYCTFKKKSLTSKPSSDDESFLLFLINTENSKNEGKLNIKQEKPGDRKSAVQEQNTVQVFINRITFTGDKK